MTCTYIWKKYNDLTATSLEMGVGRGDYPQMTLIQVSEILYFTQIYTLWTQILSEKVQKPSK